MAYSKTTQKTYGITKELAQKHLDAWLEAEMEITTHQSYQLGNRSLTMANLAEVRETIDYWEGKVASLEAAEEGNGGRNRIIRVVPRDL